MMRLLLDQGVPRSVVSVLRANSLDAEHVGDLGLASAADQEILRQARERSAVVVTLDSDFHTILAAEGAVSPSVIRFRLEGMRGEEFGALLLKILRLVSGELAGGAAVSVTKGGIRIRRLPLV